MSLSKIVRDSLNTGIDDNSDATAITIDSSENVLIDKTSSNYQTVGHELRDGGRAFHTADGSKTLSLNRLSSDGGILDFYKDNSEVGTIGTSAGQSYIHGAGTDTGLYWGSNNIYPYRSTGLNDNTIDLGQSSKRFKDLYLGGNLYLGDTGSANALDDYETGTFTPSVSGGYGSAPSYNAQTGIYTKIGKLVLAHIRIAVASGSRGGSNLTFVGLPFSNQSTIDGGGFVVYQNNFHSTGEFYPMVNASTAEIYFHEANGTAVNANELDADNYDIRIAVVYQTA